jgi:predicted metal-dependent hydrolase
MTYVRSDVDGEYYLVRDVRDKHYAANLLARIKRNIYDVTDYVYQNKEKYPNMIPYIEQLNSRIANVIIHESSINSKYTSYSVNKGEQLIFCVRTSKTGNSIHDMNLMMYVVLHEMAHVGCPEYGHTPLFKKIFAFLCHRAIEINLYEKIDFREDPSEYCGMTITDSII